MTERSPLVADLQSPITGRRAFLRAVALVSSADWWSTQAQEQADTLKVGFLVNYVPFSFVEKDGGLNGFDVQVVRLLGRLMGVTIVPVVDTMVNLQRQLKAGSIAFIGNQLLNTVENRREYDLVRPYAVLQLVCVQHEDDTRDFLSLDDLFGRKLGVLARTGVEEQARNVLGKNVVAFEKIEDGLNQLAQKKVDAMLEESLIVDYYIERDNLPIKTTTPFAAPKTVGLPVRKGDKALQDRLNAAVARMVREPAFRQISQTWFGYDVSRSRVGHSLSS